MKKQSPNSKNTLVDTIKLDLNSYAKLEQAELITRLSINTNLDRNDTHIAMCCVSDLLYDAINRVQCIYLLGSYEPILIKDHFLEYFLQKSFYKISYLYLLVYL